MSSCALARPLRPGRPLAVVLSGLPGSGKSTWARRFAARFDADHVETDRIRRALFPVRTYSPAEHAAVYRAAVAAIADALRRGRTVVFDATNLTEESRAPVRRLCDHLDAGLAIVRFAIDEAEVRRRLAARERGQDPADYSEAGLAVYEKMRGEARPVVGPHWLVRTEAEADAALEAIGAWVVRARTCGSS
ncbi:MAG: ATP-binding protein [Chloroflexota bacterium]|nr:ATP-binding protein [Dehalococcoidia bacterium]MDW8254123.1 ATP-binding protein [Chloroflexota bacterium]